MRIIAWNLNHRTIEKPIPPNVLRFLAEYPADFVVLNEFVDGASRSSFRENLGDLGYEYQLVSAKRQKQNQVFIASKFAISQGDLKSPMQDDAAITNFLHTTIDRTCLEVVGMRAPAYNQSSERRSYWREMAAIMQSADGRSIVFVGDVNHDPFRHAETSTSECRFALAKGYWIPKPVGEWSYISPDKQIRTRIDHAIVADGLKVTNAEYVSSYKGITLAGGTSDSAITDHALLALTLTL
jgi:hypothetical protein